MMFSRKKREAQETTAREVREGILQRLETQFEKAESLPDAAERFLELQAVARAAEEALKDAANRMRKEASRKGKTVKDELGLGTMSVVVSGIFVVHTPFAPLALVFLPVAKGIGRLVERRALDAARARQGDFTWAVTDILQGALAKADDIVYGNARQLAESPRCREVIEAWPRFSAAFARACARPLKSGKGAFPQVVVQFDLSQAAPKQRNKGGLIL
jgi:hypothetical protein